MGTGEIRSPLPQIERPDYDALLAALHVVAPIGERRWEFFRAVGERVVVPLATLSTAQRTVSRWRLDCLSEEPVDPSDPYPPVVVEYRGKRALYDGNHRAALAVRRQDTTLNVLLVVLGTA